MKILLCHNFYQQQGGEYQVFHDEARLLEAHGHQVVSFTRHNDELKQMSSVEMARRTLWNPDTVRDLTKLIETQRPDVMHVTNTFPLISPSAYEAAKRQGVRVVHSLHNFRLICAGATLLRDGQVCEDCVGKLVGWGGIRHRCYRDSFGASTMGVAHQVVHRLMKTWHRQVDVFVALTNFSRDKLVEGGLPAEKFVVKPNFISPDPSPGDGSGNYALFVGRLAEEKGIRCLVDAWRRLPANIALRIVGDGPLAGLVEEAAKEDPRITWLGSRPHHEVYDMVGDAACLLVPSIWYEVCPKTILEAFAKGTPVIASGLGGMLELIRHEETGLHFRPNDAYHLAEMVQSFFSQPARVAEWRAAARSEYEQKYTADRNYEMLMQIYEGAAQLVH